MVLTDKQLQAWLKSSPEKKVYIREAQGFAVRRMPTGSITFLHVYTITGKRKELVLGHYPQTSLIDARKRHRESMTSLDVGIDPQKQPNIDVCESMTVQRLIQMYLDQHCNQNKAEKTAKENRRSLEKYVLPVIGDSLAINIRRRDAVALIEPISINTPAMAASVMKIARAMFTWAMDRELVEFNPFAGVSRSVQAVKPVHRERVLTDSEIKTVWDILTDPKQDNKSLMSRRALQLILTTGQRPGEISGMSFNEIQQGEDKPLCKTCQSCGWFIIPKERSKNGKEHSVFLTPFAKGIIGKPLHPKYTGAVFWGPKTKSIGVSALSHYVIKSEKIKSQCPGWTPHDLRRTCATGLSKLGCPDEIIDAILNHTKSGVIRIYNRNKYLDEKQEWLQKWSDFLQELVN